MQIFWVFFQGSGVDLVAVQISSCEVAPCDIPINQQVTVTAEFGNPGKSAKLHTHITKMWIC